MAITWAAVSRSLAVISPMPHFHQVQGFCRFSCVYLALIIAYTGTFFAEFIPAFIDFVPTCNLFDRRDVNWLCSGDIKIRKRQNDDKISFCLLVLLPFCSLFQFF